LTAETLEARLEGYWSRNIGQRWEQAQLVEQPPPPFVMALLQQMNLASQEDSVQTSFSREFKEKIETTYLVAFYDSRTSTRCALGLYNTEVI